MKIVSGPHRDSINGTSPVTTLEHLLSVQIVLYLTSDSTWGYPGVVSTSEAAINTLNSKFHKSENPRRALPPTTHPVGMVCIPRRLVSARGGMAGLYTGPHKILFTKRQAKWMAATVQTQQLLYTVCGAPPSFTFVIINGVQCTQGWSRHRLLVTSSVCHEQSFTSPDRCSQLQESMKPTAATWNVWKFVCNICSLNTVFAASAVNGGTNQFTTNKTAVCGGGEQLLAVGTDEHKNLLLLSEPLQDWVDVFKSFIDFCPHLGSWNISIKQVTCRFSTGEHKWANSTTSSTL